jgi:endonuclease YncB( thermonuclease family)
VSKPLKLGRPTVALRPSRIRREPVQLETKRPLTKAEIEKAEARSREIEIWGGVAGVVLFATGIVALTFGISAATIFKNDPAAAAAAARFNQCYNAEGPDCVLDGDTIRVDGKKVEIAGIAAPAIVDAQCPEERSRGIDAAVRLADLLNGGNVTVGAPIRDANGREVRKVQVGGEDVGDSLIDAGLARKYDGTPQEWC